jgi:hypothetical protein
MQSIRENADRPAELTVGDLRQRNGEIQEKDSEEDSANFGESRLSSHRW